MSRPDAVTLTDLIAGSGGAGRAVSTRDYSIPLDSFASSSPFGAEREKLAGRSVALHVCDMAKAAAALIDLDGLARRILLCPPGWDATKLQSAAAQAEADALAFDADGKSPALEVDLRLPVRLPLQPRGAFKQTSIETEWILPTSGTSGPPKLAVHTLRTLVGAIGEQPLQQWATFYDIRRYGGLQIFLRALSGQGSLRLSGIGEPIENFLDRAGASDVTHISGTPTHWRKALMVGAASRIRSEIRAALRRNRRRRGARGSGRRLSERACRTRLCLDRSGRRIRRRRRPRRVSRVVPRPGRRGANEAG